MKLKVGDIITATKTVYMQNYGNVQGECFVLKNKEYKILNVYYEGFIIKSETDSWHSVPLHYLDKNSDHFCFKKISRTLKLKRILK